ncbi:hypothetical protein C8J57DRAFT_1583844 [Mycena rebaudengoi]|nr:hypothetical protein C8J57DRAFT_1583844 [Mycena rebaudengoi]
MPPLPAVTFILGGWDLGTHADLILQGILFAQFTNYWSRYYKSDSFSMKLFVLGLCIATTFKSAHAIALVWTQNVEYFMDLEKAVNMFFTNWLSQSTVIIGAIIGFYVQAFFCRRLWSYDTPGPIHYGTVVAGDVILSGSTIYFLLKRSHQALPGNVGILNRLLRIAFQSAVPVTLCALANLICGDHFTQQPDTSIDATLLFLELTTMMLPKLYANSAMWTLNSRKGSGADTNRRSSSRQMATTIQLERQSVDGGPTVRIESHKEIEPEDMFERHIKPYPDDISRQLESIPE